MMHAGMVLQGRYEIIKVIGHGGMSTVYQARDLSNGNLLAVKDVRRSGGDTNQVVEESLAAEGRMLMQLRNPHLPRIYDIIEDASNFKLVMDFIEGESLDIVIKREGAQPMDRVLDWGMQICEVFDYLHNQTPPVIYRDMKPANVILQPNGHLMMIDFGTARTEKVGVSMQADTICIGTAGFAAPEQFGGIGQSTAKTDIFCLGATLYNMITGHSPCDRPQGILPLEQWNPSLAGTPLSYIIYKCTRNDPDERYQSAAELYEDLRQARAGTFSLTKKGRGKGAEWQKQELKGTGVIAGGLSGLLQRGKTGTSGSLHQKGATAVQAPPQPMAQAVPQPVPQQPVPQPAPRQGGWQTANTVPAAPAYAPEMVSEAAYTTRLSRQSQTWRKMMLIAAVIAAAAVIFAVLMALISQIIAAVIFLVIALGGAALAVVGAVLSKRP